MYKKNITTKSSASLSTTFLQLRNTCGLEISSSDLSFLILLTANMLVICGRLYKKLHVLQLGSFSILYSALIIVQQKSLPNFL